MNEAIKKLITLKDKRNVSQIFHETANKYKDKTAVSTTLLDITYLQLEKESNKLADLLKSKGIQNEDIVAVFADKSIDTIIAILGILKSGAAYMPIDILFPNERIEYMLINGKAKYIISPTLSEKDIQEKFSNINSKIIDIKDRSDYSDSYADIRGGNESLAYVIFTSGSEGNPKGVMIEDKGIVRLVSDEDYFKINSDWNISQSGAISFDASTFEIFGALLNGATLHFIEQETLLNNVRLKEKIDNDHIDMMFITTPLFHQLVNIDTSTFENLSHLIVGGDVLLAKDVRLLKHDIPKIKLFNAYGPTENTTFSTIGEVFEDTPDNVSIGKSISYSTAYILDENGKEAGSGETGELYLGGEGVGRGYINDSSLTEKKFVKDPYTDKTMYRTGDLAMWSDDGNILFMGRADSQIKLRGFRIELQEIRSIINSIEYVNDSHVICQTRNDEKYISAFVVFDEKGSNELLRSDLEKKLPVYMVPSEIINVDKLPLKLNGKVDDKELIAIQNSRIKSESYEKNDNFVIEILNKQLGKEVSMESNLYEMGFNSISAIRVLSELRKKGYTLSMKDVLKSKKVSELVNLVTNQSTNG